MLFKWTRALGRLLVIPLIATAPGCTRALAQDLADTDADEAKAIVDDAMPLFAGYDASADIDTAEKQAAALARHEADVQAIKTAPVIEEQENGGCDEGELLWHRDVDVFVCARLCAEHSDCALPEDTDAIEPSELCVVIDMGPPADGATVAWEDVEMPDGKVALGLCDPFWQDNPNVAIEDVL